MIKRAPTAVVGSALIAAPAYAQPVETLSVSINTADLDLGSADDRARLDRRVRQAAGQICGAQPRGADLRADFQRCRGEVLSDAELKIAALSGKGAPIQLARRTR
jgi:UrcA family protein